MPSLPESGNVHGAEVNEVWHQIGEGRAPTAEETRLVEYQLDGVKQTLPRMNDYLVRLLTLSSTLAGGSLALLNEQLCHPYGRVAAGLFFAAAVVTTVLGLRPREVATRLGVLDDIRNAIDTTVKRKESYQTVAHWLLVAGLAAAVLGAGYRALVPNDLPKPTTAATQPR